MSVALAPASDTGTSNSDGITNVALPTFIGNTGDEGSSVTLFNGATPIGTGTSDAAGNYSILATAPLTEGPNAITAVKTDLAGNISLPPRRWPSRLIPVCRPRRVPLTSVSRRCRR